MNALSAVAAAFLVRNEIARSFEPYVQNSTLRKAPCSHAEQAIIMPHRVRSIRYRQPSHRGVGCIW